MSVRENGIMIDEARAAGEIRTEILGSMNKDSRVRLSAYTITPESEQHIKETLEEILSRFDQADLLMTAAIILKEIATNAVKANLKHLLLKGRTEAEAAAFLPEFRKILQTGGPAAHRAELAAAGLMIEICLQFDESGLRLSARNGFPVEGAERDRLNEKWSKALQGGDMRQFFDRNRGDAEGAGLGFTMVINALKSGDIDPKSFRFDTEEGKTAAAVFIPFKKRE